MSVSRSVTPCPAQSFCVNCICMSVHPPIRHIHTHNVFHICLCFCVHMSVYHVHSYVSVCLSASFKYTIHPFRTFLRMSVDLCVFVLCLYSCKYILHVQLFVRLFVTSVHHPLNTCLCVQLSIRLNFVSVCKSVYSSVLCLSHSYALCSLHTCPRFLPRDAYA